MAIKPIPNETQLLQKVAQGDEKAFATVFRWYYQPLGEFVLKLSGSLDATEEVIQDAFIKIWTNRETLTQIQNFNGYLYILCRNQAFQRMKQVAKQKTFQGNLEKHLAEEMLIAETDNPADHYRELIDQSVARLPLQQRKVYELSRYQRMKHEEIASALNLSQETVKKHIQLAVQFIRKDLSGGAGLTIVLILTSPLILP